MQQTEVQWVADRAQLRRLHLQHPDWSIAQLMDQTHHCRNWVKKWLTRFNQAPPDDELILAGRPTLPKTPPKILHPLVVERILDIRQHPPANLKRTPGPKTIIYFLQTDQALLEHGITPPRSPTTVWRVLVKAGYIARPGIQSHQPLSRAEPLECIAIDFKDVTSIQVDPEGKKQHLVEVMNWVVRYVSGRLERN